MAPQQEEAKEVLESPAPTPCGLDQDMDELLAKKAEFESDEEQNVVNVKPKPAHAMAYRPDIDGLRTLAVVPVVLFHAYPDLFPGGFIGVDIFFVISGYLITGILVKEFHANTFTYANFYSRRIRRIFPILLLMLTTTLWMGCLYLLADRLKCMAATMLAGSLFCANMQVLSLERGYFDPDIKTNPLLHLWSLGVEEQFYIFWPFFASLVARFSYRKAIVSQAIVLVSSFVLNVLFLGYHGSNKYSFYFPLCRFWQMSIGGLLAYFHSHHVSTSNQASIVGFLMILIGFGMIDEASAFPGFYALLPSGGAALMIAAGPQAWINLNILSNSLMVFIGKISYALYLWHWPLLVFAKLRFPNESFRPFYMQPYAMVIVAVGLSINFRNFENEVRRHKSKFIVPTLCACMVAIATVSFLVLRNPVSFSLTELDLLKMQVPTPKDVPISQPPISNLPDNSINLDPSVSVPAAPKHHDIEQDPNPSREPRTHRTTYEQTVVARADMWQAWDNGLVELNESSKYGYHSHARILNPHNEDNGLIIVLGDSHADMIKPRFTKLYEDSRARNETFPTIVFKSEHGRPPLSCHPETSKDFEMVKRVKPQAVLYTFHWIQYLRPGAPSSEPLHTPPKCCKSLFDDDCKYQNPRDRDELIRQWRVGVAELTSMGIQVYVVQRHVEEYKFYPIYWLKDNTVFQVPEATLLSEFRAKNAPLMNTIEESTRVSNATLIDYSKNLCWQDKCEVTNGDGEPLYADSNHIRAYTSRKYLSVLDQVVFNLPKMQSRNIQLSTPSATEVEDLPNPSREAREQTTTYLQAVQGGKDLGLVWKEGLADLETSSIYGFDPHAQTLNPNHESDGLVIVLGDSHADMIKPRFLKLYQDAVKKNKSFPTMVFKTGYGKAPLSCESARTNADLDMVKRVKPQAVFYSFHWLQYLRPEAPASAPLSDNPRCCKSLYDPCPFQSQKDADELLRQWKIQVKELVAMGIKVFVAQQYVEHGNFYYVYWIEGGEIKKLSPSVSRSQFAKNHEKLLNGIASAVAEANATLLNYSDNLCWHDTCEVVNGQGEPIFADDNHIRAYSARNYLSVVDQIVVAGLKS